MSSMTTVDEIASALSGMTQAQRREVGNRCGVPYDTLQKIALRQTTNPRISTYQRLVAALRKRR